MCEDGTFIITFHENVLLFRLFLLCICLMNFHLVFSDIDDQLPTTLSQLIDSVAAIGDIYEEKICLRKNDVPSAFW